MELELNLPDWNELEHHLELEDMKRIPVSLFVNVNDVNQKVDDVSKAIEWRINTMTENGERFKSGDGDGDVSKWLMS